MLTSVLNIFPGKTKEFVHRDIRTKELLCLGTQSSCSTSKVNPKSFKGCFYVQFYVSTTKLFLYFVACEDST